MEGAAGVNGAAVSQRLGIEDPDAMHEFGVQLGERLVAGDLVILTGPLGAGKTTLTRGIGEGLGVRGPVTSPTFVLARTHPAVAGGPPLVHLDAYRLQGPEEMDDLDIDFEGSVVIAEWGSGIVETGESWIELVIERPVGAGRDEGGDLGTGAGAAVDADTGADWSEAPVEPRTVMVTGHGPRWAGGVLA